MYKKAIFSKTSIERNETFEGETIEMKVRRIMSNKEPITDGAPIIHQDRQSGVEPAYNIRTDKMEVAMDAMSAVDRSRQAKRQELIKEYNEKTKEKDTKKEGENSGGDGKAESTGSTSEGQK